MRACMPTQTVTSRPDPVIHVPAAGLSLLFTVAKWVLDRSLFLLLSRVLTPGSGKHSKEKHGLSKKMAEALWKVRPTWMCMMHHERSERNANAFRSSPVAPCIAVLLLLVRCVGLPIRRCTTLVLGHAAILAGLACPGHVSGPGGVWGEPLRG